MKKLTTLLSLLLIFTAATLSSCGKGGNSPVDQIVEILDQATKKTENINSMSDLTNVKDIISPEKVWTIIQNNSDYELTKGDKEKLKKSYNKLVNTAFDKSCEFVPSEEMKKLVKNQLDLMLEAIDKNIDNATTLGDIRSLN